MPPTTTAARTAPIPAPRRHRRTWLPAPRRCGVPRAGRRPGRPAPPHARPPRVQPPSGSGPTRTGICAAWRRRTADFAPACAASQRRAKTRATDVRSTTCQRESWAEVLRQWCAGSPHDIGDVVGGEDGVGVRGQVRHRHELGEHRALEEVRPPIDEGGPVAGHRVVAPGVLGEDPSRAPAEVVERADRLRGRDLSRPGPQEWPRRRWPESASLLPSSAVPWPPRPPGPGASRPNRRRRA